MNRKASPADSSTNRAAHHAQEALPKIPRLTPSSQKHEPILEEKLEALNRALDTVTPEIRTALLAKLAAKEAAMRAKKPSPMLTGGDGNCRRTIGKSGKCRLIQIPIGPLS